MLFPVQINPLTKNTNEDNKTVKMNHIPELSNMFIPCIDVKFKIPNSATEINALIVKVVIVAVVLIFPLLNLLIKSVSFVSVIGDGVNSSIALSMSGAGCVS